jgi:hypothetical protein
MEGRGDEEPGIRFASTPYFTDLLTCNCLVSDRPR